MVWAAFLLLALCLPAAAAAAEAAKAETPAALARMPVREITVFKDGHALVLHEGDMPTDATGSVSLDYLPTPVLGTFWPYAADKDVRLSGVTATPRRVLIERTALTLRDLLDANPGVRVIVEQPDANGGTRRVEGEIVGIPTRQSAELDATSPPGAPPRLPEKGEVIVLRTADGDLVMPISRIQAAMLKGEYKRALPEEEFRNLLTLRLDWAGRQPARTARVGMMYLQKGLRWIPGYKVTVDGKGRAELRLQATLLNELADLHDVTANLVIGVPTFDFKETPDPIALQQTFAQLSQYFRTDSRTAGGFSNAIMSQAARATEVEERVSPGRAPAGDLGPEVAGTETAEDLFVFAVKNVSLAKGGRMVLPVADYALKYRDVFTLDVPFGPPPEVRASANTDQQAALARLLNAPKVMHGIRLSNTSKQPLTTAPALILSGDRVLGQGMMTYTAPGADVDLGITAAPDVRVKKTEKETKRTPNAGTWQGTPYGRVDLEGKLTLTNFRAEAIDLEVTRYVLGHAGEADSGGKAEMLNTLEDGGGMASPGTPSWWHWYSWPSWWSHVNGRARFVWTLKLGPGKSVDLGYRWHYFWG